MIRRLDGERPAFVLDTENTTYAFSVSPSGHPEHLYYGKRISLSDWRECDSLREKPEFELGNTIVYSAEYPTEMQENMCLEISSAGHGDVREPFIELVYPDGSRSTDLRFCEGTIDDSGSDLTVLPCSYAEKGSAEHLCIVLRDNDTELELHYRVYPKCDVITRSARLINKGKEPVIVERLMSAQLDLPFGGLSVTSFHGAWAREMNKSTIPINAGKYVIESRTGCSSNRTNPFFMVHDVCASENSGSVYGFNLVYSGNHYSAVEVNSFGKTRIVTGIQPQGSSFVLEEGEKLEVPEAVMTYSSAGFTGQSINMHNFVRNHIIRGKWKGRERPVLLNSWEACYFKVNKHKMITLARIAKKLGAELFVMDDGWFGKRNNDSCSLGDWDADTGKLPGGLKALGDKIKSIGMDFGIWVEPEMVNTDSELYRLHPEWVMQINGRLHSEGRKQRVLDLANRLVQDHLIEKMTEVFSSACISYVKWDMNRIFSDVFSPSLPAVRQGETAYRYICGLYRIIKELTERFPDILFEGCASGGNRFDLGMLCYFPQIWASDNTDAVCRASIQEGYSYAYPQCCIGAHVSAVPNHQTLRITPPETRFGAASFGILGYELDVRDLSSRMRKKIRKEIGLYKKWRGVFQVGQFYRISTSGIHIWISVSEDRSKAAAFFMQELAAPNFQLQNFTAAGLDPYRSYHMYSIPRDIDIKLFGNLINTVSPVNIRQDSLIHNMISGTVKMNGESEDITVPGSVLMSGGVTLKPAFSGTGFNENVRIFPDFDSRMYFIEAVE